MNFFESHNLSQLFDGLDTRELELIAAQSVVKNFKKGELIFYEEDNTDYWFSLLKGRLRAFKSSQDEHEISLCQLEVGMAVNDLQRDQNRYKAVNFASLEGVSDGIIIGIKASALPLLFTQIPDFAYRCFNLTLTSIERYQRAFYSGMVLDAMGKVAFMMSSSIEKFNSMKKQEIALSLNIQPETLSRLLAKLARKNIIQNEGNIKILDYDALRSLY